HLTLPGAFNSFRDHLTPPGAFNSFRALIIFQYLIVIYIIPNILEHQNRIDLVADVAKFANPLIGTAGGNV
ncbi:19969_t:CDS:2, partial [Dentiscutata erythropus]